MAATAKQQLCRKNIEELLAGKGGFHVFLWGEPGMGKTSAVYALLHKFKFSGLKLIEISKTQLAELGVLFRKLAKAPEKFLLLCDDLSFDEDDRQFKQLKVNLDQQLGIKANALLHVTSNRGSLVNFKQKPDREDVSNRQLIHEVQALNDRFGLKLYFEALRFEKLDLFIEQYAKQQRIKLDDLTPTKREFQRFCLKNQHSQPSARTVKQFFAQYRPA